METVETVESGEVGGRVGPAGCRDCLSDRDRYTRCLKESSMSLSHYECPASAENLCDWHAAFKQVIQTNVLPP